MSQPAPVVKIFVRETGQDLDYLRGFLQKCLSKDATARPYINENFSNPRSGYTGLIYEYDAQTMRDALPGGRYREAQENFFREIANQLDINIVLVNSESTYCQATKAFADDLKPIIHSIPASSRKTVVILVVCGSEKKAVDFNRKRTTSGNDLFLGSNGNTSPESHMPYFLGCEGTVHTIKEHIFICTENFREIDYPTRICATEKVPQNNVNADALKNVSSSSATYLQRNSPSDRLKCCKTMIQQFPIEFVESFKTDRNCIKLTKEKIIERITNLLRTNGLEASDASIRKYRSPSDPGDGILCKGKGDPCGIDRDKNIVSRNTINSFKVYSNQISDAGFGKLIKSIIGNGKDFIQIWRTLEEETKQRYAQTQLPAVDIADELKNQTLLTLVLKNTPSTTFPTKKIADKIKLNIIKELLHYGANVNIQIVEEGFGGLTQNYFSIPSFILYGYKFVTLVANNVYGARNSVERYEPPALEIINYILLNSDINLEDDAILAQYSQDERKIDTINKNINPILNESFLFRVVQNAAAIINRNFPRYSAREIEGKRRKQQILKFIEIIGRHYNMNFNLAILGYPGFKKQRTFEENYEILTTLLRKIRIGEEERTLFSLMSDAILSIANEGSQETFNAVSGNIIQPRVAPIANAVVERRVNNLLTAEPPRGLHVGGRRSKTKKNRRAKRQTRRR